MRKRWVVVFAMASIVAALSVSAVLGNPNQSPFEGVWEASPDRWIYIIFVTGGVYSIDYYEEKSSCYDQNSLLGFGGGVLEDPNSMRVWIYWFCLNPPNQTASSFFVRLIYDESNDSLTGDDGTIWNRTNARWHNIIP